jgi:hypothetical protein
MSTCVAELIQLGQQLFEKRGTLLSLWQEIADNFYPERADFTVSRSLGTDFASNLMSSYPVLCRRDLGDSFSSMLRTNAKEWFGMSILDREILSHNAKKWLQAKSKLQRRMMYDSRTGFVKSTKQGDHDFATFGQAVISVDLNRNMDGLLYRNWHLRDVAWVEDENGQIDTIIRRWKPTVRDLMKMWPGKLPDSIKNLMAKEPFKEFEAYHAVMPATHYHDGKNYRTPYVSVYVLVEGEIELECVGSWTLKYVIPRWQTVSGSQYAYSPATIAALPDARLIQSMTHVLLEAGEKAVTPPMVAVQEAIRSDLAVYAGGVTWVDSEYDERLGEVLRPLTQDRNGVPLGIEMARDTKDIIKEAFYLNKLSMPQTAGDMTAYEVGQRVQEYIRQAMPIFEPIEQEYNGALCEMTFETILHANGFGSMEDMPKELQDEEIQFVFESPLHEATERAKSQVFIEARNLLAEAVALDPTASYMIDAKVAIRDVLDGIGVPTTWTRSESEVAERAAEDTAKAEMAQFLELAQQGSDVAATSAAAMGGPRLNG